MQLTREQLIKLIQESYQDIIQEDENRQPRRNIEPTPSQRRGSTWEDSYKGEPVTDLQLNLDDLQLSAEDIGLDSREGATTLPSFDPNLLNPEADPFKKGSTDKGELSLNIHGGGTSMGIPLDLNPDKLSGQRFAAGFAKTLGKLAPRLGYGRGPGDPFHLSRVTRIPCASNSRRTTSNAARNRPIPRSTSG